MLSMDGHNCSIRKRFSDIDLYTKTKDVKNLLNFFSQYIMRQIDMWFGRSVVGCRNGIPEALGSNPGRARQFSPPVTFWRPTWDNPHYDWLLLRHLENISQCFSVSRIRDGILSLEGLYVAGCRYLVIYRSANRHVAR